MDMKTLAGIPVKRPLIFGALLVTVAMAVGTAYAGSSTDEALIRGVIDAYARSIDAADTNLGATIWAQTADVSFIYPRGHAHGWESIKANVYEQLMGQRFSERKLTVKDPVVHVYGDTAWAEFYWEFNAKLRRDDSPVTTRGRETQVYRRVDGTWRIVHVHYSGMPITEEG